MNKEGMEVMGNVDVATPHLAISTISNKIIAKKIQHIISRLKSPENSTTIFNLHTYAALLSGLIARRHNSFRKIIGFKSFHKLNTALNYLTKNDIYKTLNTFSQSVFTVSVGENIQYVLTRLVSLHKLYQRVTCCCTESADYFLRILRNNYFMDTILLILVVVSDIWDCAKRLGNILAEIYDDVVLLNFYPVINLPNIQYPSQLHKFHVPKWNKIHFNEAMSSTVKMATQSIKLGKCTDVGVAISRSSLQPSVLKLSNSTLLQRRKRKT